MTSNIQTFKFLFLEFSVRRKVFLVRQDIIYLVNPVSSSLFALKDPILVKFCGYIGFRGYVITEFVFVTTILSIENRSTSSVRIFSCDKAK